MDLSFKRTYWLLIIFTQTLIWDSSSSLYAQNTLLDEPVTIEAHETRIPDILEMISRKYTINFSYNADIINPQKKISVSFQNTLLEEAIQSMLADSTIQTTVFDQQIIIFEKKSEYNSTPEPVKEITQYISFRGSVVDQKTGEELPYAHMYLEKAGLGTITNADGEYLFKVPERLSNDLLIISYMGYKNEKLPLDSMLNENQIIGLTPAPLILEEVQVLPLNPGDIIKKAVSEISSNYSTRPMLCNAFFREYSLENNQYIALSEAVVDIYKSPYHKYYQDFAKIIKARKSEDVKRMKQVEYKMQGGIYYNMKLDVVSELATFLDENYFDVYEYKLSNIVNQNGRYFYEISFDQKEGVSEAYYSGKIYIDVKTYAISKVEFQVSERGIENATEFLVRKTPRQFDAVPLFAKYQVNYINRKNKWYLSNTRSEVGFKVNKRKGEYESAFNTTSEFLITRYNSGNARRFKRKEMVKSTDILVDEIKHYNEGFWGAYNIIKPRLSITEAYQQLSGKNSHIITFNVPEL